MNNRMVKIDKHVPMPIGGGGAKPKYPWKNMKVGDSFFIFPETNEPDQSKTHGSVKDRL